ncbi:MAG: hypothetical protein ACRC2T_12195 [Thermoguttaceae bacterium]
MEIIANAEQKTIAFAPVPGEMRKHLLSAIKEVHAKICEISGSSERIFMGKYCS